MPARPGMLTALSCSLCLSNKGRQSKHAWNTSEKISDIFLHNIKDSVRMLVLLCLRWKTYKSHAESASADDRVSIYAIVLQIIELYCGGTHLC